MDEERSPGFVRTSSVPFFAFLIPRSKTFFVDEIASNASEIIGAVRERDHDVALGIGGIGGRRVKRTKGVVSGQAGILEREREKEKTHNSASQRLTAEVKRRSKIYSTGPSSLRQRSPTPLPLAPPIMSSPLSSSTGAPPAVSSTSSFSVFSLISPVFWREVFDVTTADVIERLRLSILPTSSFSLLTAVQLRPDWWGPFWIAATLALLVAAGGQFGGWLAYSMPPGCMEIKTDVASCEGAIYAGHPFMRDNYCCTADGAAMLTSLQAGRKVAAGWRFDIYSVVSALILFDGFLLIAPLTLRAAFAYIGLSPQGATATGAAPLGVVHLVCIYGYALSALIPASLLCATGNNTLQWIVIFAACTQGLIVAVQNIYRPLAATAHMAGQRRPVFVLGLIAFHFVSLAIVLKTIFYKI